MIKLLKRYCMVGAMLVMSLNLTSCFPFFNYSFTGADISPDVKTVSIDFFQNMAPIVVPSLSNTFTEALRERFVKQTRLQLVNTDGDLHYEGEIVGYDVIPVAVTAEDQAAKNRLTIRVKVRYTNNTEHSKDFEQDFSAYEEFPGEQSLDAVQDALIEKIVKVLIEDIFNSSVATW